MLDRQGGWSNEKKKDKPESTRKKCKGSADKEGHRKPMSVIVGEKVKSRHAPERTLKSTPR